MLTCRFGKITDDLAPIPGWATQGARGISETFARESSGTLMISVEAGGLRQTIHPPQQTGPELSSYDLHNALRMLAPTPAPGSDLTTIALLFAPTFRSYPSAFGVMFDTGFDIDGSTGPQRGSLYGLPREGAAVFLNAIWAQRSDNPAAYERQVMFSSIHELGHVFNLEHVESQPNFMHTSDKIITVDGSYYHFIEEHRARLKNASTRSDTWPGRSPFSGRDYNDYFQRAWDPWAEPRRQPFGLDLRVTVARASFHHYEPVELQIELSVAPSLQRRFRVPDMIDPGYEQFRLWIEEPSGDRRRYRSPRLYCWHGRRRTVTAEKPFRRDISFFGEAGGYTFRCSGVHRVWAEFAFGRAQKLRSNTLEIEIHALSGERVDDLELFTARDTRILLYHRLDRNGGSAVRRMEDWLEQRRSTSAHGAVRYALGRALLERAKERGANSNEIATVYRRADDHLTRAIDDVNLGEHQRSIAGRELRSIRTRLDKLRAQKKSAAENVNSRA